MTATAFLRRFAVFAAIGVALYAGLYVAAESLASRHGDRNRFLRVRTSAAVEYDYLMLGASHAAVFDYQDMNAQLEAMTGGLVLNLAEVGSGVTVNRLLLDYFFTRRTAKAVVYVVDSFAFYSAEWNEERLGDAALFARAPFDPALARLLLRDPAGRRMWVDYVTGFSKINNRDRFEPDVFPDAAVRFERTYRPVGQIDRQRIEYLYPEVIEPDVFERYLDEFERLVTDVRARGARFLVVRPPIPERVRRLLPDEDGFDQTLRARVTPLGAEWHDFSRVANDDGAFYDTDHLNRAGALTFLEQYLVPVLVPD